MPWPFPTKSSGSTAWATTRPMAEMPFALKTTADFFARDLAAGRRAAERGIAKERTEKTRRGHATSGNAAWPKSRSRASITPWNCDSRQRPAIEPPLEGRLRIRRDSGKRFSLSCKLPLLGDMSLGQGDYPWIVSNGTVLAGTENPGPALKSSARFHPCAAATCSLRMLAGLLQRRGRHARSAAAIHRAWKTIRKPTACRASCSTGKEPISARVRYDLQGAMDERFRK